MESLAVGAAMMSTKYFLWARCAQHGGVASGGGLVCVSLRSYRAKVTGLYIRVERKNIFFEIAYPLPMRHRLVRKTFRER